MLMQTIMWVKGIIATSAAIIVAAVYYLLTIHYMRSYMTIHMLTAAHVRATYSTAVYFTPL